MSKPQELQWRTWVIGDAKDYTFIETGCNKGLTLRKAANVFPVCHSIELDWGFFGFCKSRFKDSPNCTVHYGSSEDILPGLIAKVHGPICFWLDAHGSPNTPRGGHVPLMLELALAVAHGDDRDVIAIDDTRCFGRDARDRMGDNWKDITLKRVEALLHEGGFGNIKHYHEDLARGGWHRSGVMVAKR